LILLPLHCKPRGQPGDFNGRMKHDGRGLLTVWRGVGGGGEQNVSDQHRRLETIWYKNSIMNISAYLSANT
jgi:hypothetical protein